MESVRQTFLLITIQPQKLSDEDMLKELTELKSLVETYGGEVVDLIVQKREVHDKGSYIGEGKINDVAKLIKEKHISGIVLNAIVKPGQLYDLKKRLHPSNADLLVWDRVDLILHIFAKHASTAEAKLQIELAAMRHMGPRIYGMGKVLSRQGGGIGTLGIGETNTELMKRHWREQMKKVNSKLSKLSSERENQLRRRQRMGFKTVSIIGYTNAGKTALFNVLTDKKKYVKDELFATLDSSVGKLFFPKSQRQVLFSDTIGFIQNLPPELIEAFKSTLLEALHADLLLHVIDCSDMHMEEKVTVVHEIIKELRIQNLPMLYVFNKCDQITKNDEKKIKDTFSNNNMLFISAKQKLGLDQLLHSIEEKIPVY